MRSSQLLLSVFLLGILLASGCQSEEKSTSSTNVQTASIELSTGEVAAYQAEVMDPSSSASQMKESAMALISTLSAVDAEKAMYKLTDDSVRTNWSNLPASIVERFGVRVGDLSDEQRILFHDLIRASSSSQGYQKMAGIMWLDDILHEQSQERLAQNPDNEFFARLVESWSSDNYWFSFFGNPATDANWGWLLSGHHLAANFTVAGDKVGFTPTFLGAEPYEVEKGPFAGWRTLSHEVERGYELMQALSSEQRDKVLLDVDIPRDVLEGPGRKASLKRFEGLAVSDMTDAQQKLTWRLIEEYVRNADHDAAEAQLMEIDQDGLDKLFFSWIGPSDDIDKRYYYRVHGPSILIEYIRERGVGGDRGAANHVHSIVRDPGNDYGEDWLEMHYKEHHRGGPGGGGGGPRR